MQSVSRPAGLRMSAVALALALASTQAFSSAPVDLTSYSLEELLDIEVTTASKFAQKASQAPSSVSVVTAEDIRLFGYRTLADILQSIRGLYVVNDRNYSYLGVRGFGRSGDYNTRVLILIDGFRVNDNIYDSGFIGTEFPLDVDLIQQVEFAPGPGSAVYGNSAFLGVVNVITKKGSGIGGAQVSGELASNDTVKGRISYGRKFDNGADLLMSLSRYRSDGEDLRFPEFASMNNGVANGLDDDDYRQMFAKLHLDGLMLEGIYATRTKGIPTASFSQVFNDPRSETTDEELLVNARYTRNINSTLEATGLLSYGQYNYDGKYLYDYPPVDINKDGARGRWWGGEFRLVSTAFDGHKFMIGGELRRDFRQDQYNRDDYGMNFRDSHTRTSYAAYAQDEYRVLENLSLTLGARFDYFKQAGNSEHTFNPRVAAVYKLRSETTLKAMAGSAFRAPNVYEKYYTAADYLINPDLEPERIWTYELAVDHYWAKDLRTVAAVYYYRIDDLITLTDVGGGVYQFVNTDKAKAHGLELEAEKVWPGGTRLRGSYTFQLATDEDTGARLTNSPKHLLKLNLSTPLWNAWQLGFESGFTSQRRTVAGGDVSGYAVSNLVLSSNKLVKGMDVSIGLYNLFDRDYFDPASEEHQDSNGFQLNGIPQSSRTWRLKLGYTF